MSYDFLRFRFLGTGLLSAWLLIGCGGDAAAPASEDNSDTDTSSDQDTGKGGSTSTGGKKDAGTSTSGATKDAGSSGGGTSTDKGKGLPCDVQTIIQSKCGTCHGESPSFGAPMALASAADFAATASDGTKMHASVKARMNETDVRKRMPPASSTKLTDAELATVNAWLDKGATASTASCGGSGAEGETPEPEAPINPEDLDCYKITSGGQSKFKVGVANDAYFNYVFTPPWKGTVYGVTFKPIIDNMKVIHHWLLFQDTVPGVPGMTGSIGAHPGGTLLTGWAPGGEATDFTKDTADVGIELSGATTYTLEYHYNSSDPAAQDASGVEICVHTRKPKNIAGLSWLGLDQLGIPAQKWTGTCRPTAQQPIRILSVTPHMHKAGTHMKGTINRASGMKEVLHDEPFDFDYQRSYTKDVMLMPGDSITTECTFSRPMAFGESTNAEMCYLFTLAYPKGALSDLGPWGAFAHGSGSCLGQ
ncbi:MAG: c-type cytochrome [Polyangiales bacterium]